VFLGARLKTGQEIGPEDFTTEYPVMRSFKTPKRYELSNMTVEDIQELVNKFDSTQEGLVIQDAEFHRIKIKGSAYLAVHRLKDSNGQLSHEHVLKCIQENTVDDVLGLFPEYTQKIRSIMNLYKDVSQKLSTAIVKSMSYYDVAKKNEDPKAAKKMYALLVKDEPLSKFYFKLYQNWTHAEELKRDFLKGLDYETLVRLTK
jgi:hypothetical protein